MVDEPVPASAGATARVVAGDTLRYGWSFLGKHGWRMALWFVFLLIPLWGFAALVGEIHEHEVFPFDAPILSRLHALSTPARDHFFVLMSQIGLYRGVVPVDAGILATLTLRQRYRDGLFFGIAIIGSALLNTAAKTYFARMRPDLWLSIAPETTYSFPSGHAMGSATLGAAVILMYWPGRWRWVVSIASVVFVLLVGVSRVYLGVHYPSDILAGWAAAIAWTIGMYILVDQKAPTPPPRAIAGNDKAGLR